MKIHNIAQLFAVKLKVNNKTGSEWPCHFELSFHNYYFVHICEKSPKSINILYFISCFDIVTLKKFEGFVCFWEKNGLKIQGHMTARLEHEI